MHIEDDVVAPEVVENFIGNSVDGGVRIGLSPTGTVVRGNRIGVSLDGGSIPNRSSMLLILTGSSGSRIGPNNVIANNLASGIRVRDAFTDRNTITSNSIYGYQKLGIEIDPVGTVNPNDVGDADAGPIEMATPQQVAGSACGGCTVGVFRADRGNGGYGQGKTLVASAIADSGGSFLTPVGGVAEGDHVSATATNAAGNTSEFSLDRTVVREVVNASSHLCIS